MTNLPHPYALCFRSADQSLLVVPKSKRRLRRHFLSWGISSPNTLGTPLLSRHTHLPCSSHTPPFSTLLCCIFPPLLIARLTLFSCSISSTCFQIVSPITDPTWCQPPLYLCPGETTSLLSLTTIIACCFLISVCPWLSDYSVCSWSTLTPSPSLDPNPV